MIRLRFTTRTRCGVEISSGAIKYVLVQGGRTPRLLRFGRVPLREGESAGAALHRLCAAGEIPRAGLRVALGTQPSILRMLTLPPMPGRDLERVIAGEVAKERQIFTEEMSVAHEILPPISRREPRSVLVALTPRAGLDAFRRETAAHGLRLELLTTTSLSLLTHVRGLRTLAGGKEAVAVLHLGADRMVMAVLQGGTFRQFRDLGVGLDASLLEQRGTGTGPETFVEAGAGFDPAPPDGPAGSGEPDIDWDALDQIGRGLNEVEQVARQVRRTLEVDARAHPLQPVRRVILAGDATRGEAMAPLLQNEVGLPVSVLDPFEGLSAPDPAFGREAASFAVTLALARASHPGRLLDLARPASPAYPASAWGVAALLAAASVAAGMVAGRAEDRGRQLAAAASIEAAGTAAGAERLRTAGGPGSTAAANGLGEEALRGWMRAAGRTPREPLEWLGRNLPPEARAERIDLLRRGPDWAVRCDGSLAGAATGGRLRAWTVLADSLGGCPRIGDPLLAPLAGERPSVHAQGPFTATFRYRVRP